MIRFVLVLLILGVVGFCPVVVAADDPVEVVSNVLTCEVDCCEREPCPGCPECSDVAPMAVSTRSVESVGEVSAVLEGLLSNDGGGTCSVSFVYGASTSYGLSTPWVLGKVSGASFNASVEDLLPGTVYHYRVRARNATVAVEGSDETFVTLPHATIVITATTGVGQVTLTWTKGAGATRTLIKRGTTSIPTIPAEGNLVYFGPDATCVDVGLAGGVTYQYAVWSEANGVYSATALTLTAVPLAAEPPPSTDWWLPIIAVLGIGAVIALYIIFKHRRPEPLPASPVKPEHDKKPSGGKESEKKESKKEQEKEPEEIALEEPEEVKGAAEEEVAVAVVEEPEAIPEEAPEEKGDGSGFDEHAPPCSVCQSRITQLKEGTEKTYVCMKCGHVFEKDA